MIRDFFRYGALLCLLAHGALSTNAEARKTIDDYWDELGWKFSRVTKSIANDKCYQSEKDFFACTEAINAILDYSPDSWRLVPESYRSSHSEYAAAVNEFGGASIAEAPKSKAETIGAMIRESRVIKKEIHEAWNAEFKASSTKRTVDFEAISKHLQGQPFFSKNESRIVGAVTNAFYHVRYDPHTTAMPIKAYEAMFKGSDEDVTVGIGAGIDMIESNGKKVPVIMSVLEDSPAHISGVMPKDILTAIDGASVDGLTIDEIVAKVRGPQDSKVKIEVLRGQDKREIEIVRKPLAMKNVVAKTFANSEVGYVRLRTFMAADGCIQTREALRAVIKKGVKSLIFDLRDNGGGQLSEAECIANLFLDLKTGEPIVSTKTLVKDKPSMVLPVGVPAKIETDLPMVLLMNAHSASASELVAGALQDYERAVLLGDKSYGKGSVQTFQPLGLKGELVLKQTTARFYRPSGRTNQIVTVEPDITRHRNPNPTPDDMTAMREEDEYAALPPVGNPWKQTRPELMTKVEDCMNSRGTAEADFQKHKGDAIGPDYQLYSAIDAAQCLVAEKLWSIADKRPTFGWPDWILKEKLGEFFTTTPQDFNFDLERRIH